MPLIGVYLVLNEKQRILMLGFLIYLYDPLLIKRLFSSLR